MRIAFDLDDTLIPTTVSFSVGASKSRFPYNLLSEDELRRGASELLSHLSEAHDVWIYTTSLRSPRQVKYWLKGYGVNIRNVVNSKIHADTVKGTSYQKYSKAPALFGIDCLIDNSVGVLNECHAQRVKCVVVSPDELCWTDKVLREISSQFAMQ